MKFIQIITIVTLYCVNIGTASPLTQLINNEDEVLARDDVSSSNELSRKSDGSSSEESHEGTTVDDSIYETRLYPISPSAISKVPFIQAELRENFPIGNDTQPIKIQSFGLLSAFNLPWLSEITFHKPDSAELETIEEIKVTVSGELFTASDEEIDTTTMNAVTQDDSNKSAVKNSTTTTTTSKIIPSTIETTTKKLSVVSVANVTSIITTTKTHTAESIKEKLIEKIAEIAAEPIILTQGVR